MPYADPEKSFDAAVNHLFRHVSDGLALRKNPIVKYFFIGAKSKRDESSALLGIRNRIASEADACYADAAAAGDAQHARRQRAIVEGILSDTDFAGVAEQLKLSRRQYYRERHEICSRIARRMQAGAAPAAHVRIGDPRQLLFSRASAFADQGLSARAVTLLDTAWTGFSPGRDRSVARLELVDALVSAGDLQRARRLLDYAREGATGDDERAELAERGTLVEARYALASGADSEASTTLDGLVDRQTHAQRIDEVALDAAVEAGLVHCGNARFEPARKMLRRANVIVAKLPNVAPHRRVALALLHAYCAEDLDDDYRGSYQRFAAALELSIASASVRGALESTIGLMGYYGSVGRNDEMLEMAERALELARAAEGPRHKLFAAAWIATTLLKTPYWQAADPLVFEAERIALPGSLHWTFVKEAQADLFAHKAQYANAERSFAEAGEAARSLHNKKWEAIVLRDLGLMLKRLGSREGVDSMRRAVELAEHSAGAWSLALTYRAASEVLPGVHPGRLYRQPPSMSASQRKRYAKLTLFERAER